MKYKIHKRKLSKIKIKLSLIMKVLSNVWLDIGVAHLSILKQNDRSKIKNEYGQDQKKLRHKSML